jgi:hypothetical protein
MIVRARWMGTLAVPAMVTVVIVGLVSDSERAEAASATEAARAAPTAPAAAPAAPAALLPARGVARGSGPKARASTERALRSARLIPGAATTSSRRTGAGRRTPRASPKNRTAGTTPPSSPTRQVAPRSRRAWTGERVEQALDDREELARLDALLRVELRRCTSSGAAVMTYTNLGVVRRSSSRDRPAAAL